MNLRIFVDFCTVVIAVCALVLSIWQGIENRQFNRLASRPILVLGTQLADQNPELGLKLSNEGPGPALIKKLTVFIDGKPVVEDSAESIMLIVRRKCGLGDSAFIHSWLGHGAPFGSGKERFLLGLKRKNLTKERREHLEKALKKVIFIIDYESVYGEKFTAKSRYRLDEQPQN